jgi:predicted secreted Zn-dependent protease
VTQRTYNPLKNNYSRDGFEFYRAGIAPSGRLAKEGGEMFAKWVIGACIALVCAAPVLGEEDGGVRNLKVSKYIEQGQAFQKLHELSSSVKVKENFEYYDITGTTSEELRAQMKRNGTTWNDGSIYAALTTWDIHYNYDITSVDGRYVLSSIKTDVDIVFHFPRLLPSAKTPEQLITSWNSYLEHLKTHEFGHRDIAVGIGQDIYQALSSLGSSSSKRELDREAKNLINARFQSLKEVQVEYDLDTHHGIKQWAVLTEPLLAASATAH